MKKVYSILALCCIFSITSCGGGGSGAPAVGVATQAIDGIWFGTFTSTPIATTYNIVGVVAPNNQMRFVSTTPAAFGAQYIGTASVTGNSFSAPISGLAPAGFIFLNGANTTTGTLNGTVVANTSLSGTYTSINDNGTFSLTYSPIYNRPASLALLARTWTGPMSNGGTATITISAAGAITGTDTLGCSIAGTVSIIDPIKNIYNTSVTVSTCAPVATFTGFMVLDDVAPGTSNLLDFIVSSTTQSVFGQLQ